MNTMATSTTKSGSQSTKRKYTKRGEGTFKTPKEWVKGWPTCKAVEYRRVDANTHTVFCSKTGDKCKCALCPKVKKNQ